MQIKKFEIFKSGTVQTAKTIQSLKKFSLLLDSFQVWFSITKARFIQLMSRVRCLSHRYHMDVRCLGSSHDVYLSQIDILMTSTFIRNRSAFFLVFHFLCNCITFQKVLLIHQIQSKIWSKKNPCFNKI